MTKKFIAPVAMLALTLVSNAYALDSYDLRDVVEQRIPFSINEDVPPATQVTGLRVDAPPDCKVSVQRVATNARQLEIVPDGGATACDVLWNRDDPPGLKLTFTLGSKREVTLARAAVGEVADNSISLKDGKLTAAEALPKNSRLIFFAGAGKSRPWITLGLKAGVFEVADADKAEVAAILKRAEVSFYLDDGTTLKQGKLAPPKTTLLAPTGTADGLASASVAAAMRCDAVRNARVICVDFLSERERPELQFQPNTGHVIPPNQDVVVRVRHERRQTLAISMGGARGLVVPGTRNLTEVPDNQSKGALLQSDPVVTAHTFAPRLPGEADVTIVLHENGKQASEQKIELVVDQTYSGAVRLGIGLPFLGAKDAAYTVSAAQGSSQPEIVSKTFGGVDLELVVGYSAYLDEGGRSLVRRSCSLCLSPFIGVGVWAPEATGVEFLKTLYLGIEAEPTPNFSFSFNAVARRVTRLRDGYHVGEAFDGTDVPTRTGIGLGLGVVATFSPDFLRLARPAAASFLK